MQFSIFLSQAMQGVGLTQNQLSERSGISQGAISRYLNNKASPKADEVLRISKALGVSVDWLLTGKQSEPGLPAFLEKLRAAKSLALASTSTLKGAESEFDSIMQIGILSRRIQIVGWAHAGPAAGYEEIASDHQESIPTDCRDPKAFGVTLEGDSMEPYFRDGDQLVLMPSEEAHSGCYAVCRFADDGVLFRRIEFIGSQVRLMPSNERYDATVHHRSEFSWIYPIWERRTQLWK